MLASLIWQTTDLGRPGSGFHLCYHWVSGCIGLGSSHTSFGLVMNPVGLHRPGRTPVRWSLLVLFSAAMVYVVSSDETSPNDSDPSGVTDVVVLKHPELLESSGLAVSNLRSSTFWTHNDSGGKPKLYAFDQSGRKLGSASLDAVRMNDWEDMASYRDQGIPRLLVADCGDNTGTRSRIELHLFDEPDPTETTEIDDKLIQTIGITYPNGPRDCEAVAVDTFRECIILVTKSRFFACDVYTIPLPRRELGVEDYRANATHIVSLSIPMVTAMDIDVGNGDLWISSYFQVFRFPASSRTGSLRKQLSEIPEAFDLPRWRQIEAVAVDQSHSLWLTSEGSNPPLGRLPPGITTRRKGADPVSAPVDKSSRKRNPTIPNPLRTTDRGSDR